MKALRNMALLVFAFALFEHAMLCQSSDADSLKGITAVGVLVDGTLLNPCGISKEEVITSVKFIIGQSSIRLSDKSTYSVYVSINSLDDCVASPVDVYVVAPVTVIGTGTTDYGALVWNKGGVLSGPNQKERILAQVESFCKSMVVDWNSVNHK